MSEGTIKVRFQDDWLKACRKAGRRVLRELEQKIAEHADFKLVTSGSNELTVRLPFEARATFVGLVSICAGEGDDGRPWKHVAFSGDVNGLDLPSVMAEPEEKCPPTPQEETVRPDVSVPAGGRSAPAAPEPQPQPTVDPAQVLDEICRSVPVRHCPEMEAYVRETAAVIPVLQRMKVTDSLWHQHLLLSMEAGYGRTDFLRSLVRLYRAWGLLGDVDDARAVKELIVAAPDQETDGYVVDWDRVVSAAGAMRDGNRREITRCVLYVDISAWHGRLQEVEVKRALRQLNLQSGSFLIVFRVPFLEGHVLRQTSEALNDILNVRTLSVPPAAMDKLTDYARERLGRDDFVLTDNAVAPFEQWVLREKSDNSFFGYKTVDKMVQRMIFEKAVENGRTGGDSRQVDGEILRPFGTSQTVDENPERELGKLVGMRAVESKLHEIITQIKAHRQLVGAGKHVERPAFHMLFTGNPGTGKTTVARIAAQMMHKAGILRKGHIVEIRGRDLCGRYVGETAPKTSAICRDAYGSVLFIDEAYSLFRGEYESARDYGREALDTLVAEMENHRDDMCVIMAGYKDEMSKMLEGNAGLRSRIPYEIEFANYTRADLEEIFFNMMDGRFDYDDGLRNAVRDFLAEIPDNVLEAKSFSNARFVRNLYERTWGKAVCRNSMSGTGAIRILPCDLVGAAGEREFRDLVNQNSERRVIGFGR